MPKKIYLTEQVKEFFRQHHVKSESFSFWQKELEKYFADKYGEKGRRLSSQEYTALKNILYKDQNLYKDLEEKELFQEIAVWKKQKLEKL